MRQKLLQVTTTNNFRYITVTTVHSSCISLGHKPFERTLEKSQSPSRTKHEARGSSTTTFFHFPQLFELLLFRATSYRPATFYFLVLPSSWSYCTILARPLVHKLTIQLEPDGTDRTPPIPSSQLLLFSPLIFLDIVSTFIRTSAQAAARKIPIMSPPAVAPAALGSAGKEYKRESGTARLLGSG